MFISDYMLLDVDFVYMVIKETVTEVQGSLEVTEVQGAFFSDGCSGQYKNCKNSFNLSCNEHDFDVSWSWLFFATSHGKSPCGGICCTLKRLSVRANLQRPMNNQILKRVDFFNFCNDRVISVILIFLSHEQIEHCRSL